MFKFEVTRLILVLLSFFIALPVRAQFEMPHMHMDFFGEKSWSHVGLMIILFFIVIISVMLSWSCSMVFVGRMGKAFEFIAIGFGILSLLEIINILNHLGWVITESSIEHIISVTSFSFISFGFYSILKAGKNNKK
jgi:hypothetical protein